MHVTIAIDFSLHELFSKTSREVTDCFQYRITASSEDFPQSIKSLSQLKLDKVCNLFEELPDTPSGNGQTFPNIIGRISSKRTQVICKNSDKLRMLFHHTMSIS